MVIDGTNYFNCGVRALPPHWEFAEGTGDEEKDLIFWLDLTGLGLLVVGPLLFLLCGKHVLKDNRAGPGNSLLHLLHIFNKGVVLQWMFLPGLLGYAE